MDGLFSEVGIYSSKGQLYDPVDRSNAAYYRESKTGQLLEEGINEAGSMADFVAAGTGYCTHGVPTIPFYIYYRCLIPTHRGPGGWRGDSRARGFLWEPPPAGPP